MSEETTANFRNSLVARSEVASFVSWLQQRGEFSQAEKDKVASLAAEYQRSKSK